MNASLDIKGKGREGKELIVGWQESGDDLESVIHEPEWIFAGDLEHLQIIDPIVLSRKCLKDADAAGKNRSVHLDCSGSGDEMIPIEGIAGLRMIERDFLLLEMGSERGVHDGVGKVMPEGSGLAARVPPRARRNSQKHSLPDSCGRVLDLC